MTNPPTPEAAPRGQEQTARGTGGAPAPLGGVKCFASGNAADIPFSKGFAAGNAALRRIGRFSHLSLAEQQAEELRFEGVPVTPIARPVDEARLQELALLQAAALDAQRIAKHEGNDAAYIEAGRDLGGYEAEIHLLLPDDPDHRRYLRQVTTRQMNAERERLRLVDRMMRAAARAATEQPTPRGSGQSQAGA